MAEDYYQQLGVARDANSEQIQKAYRDLARKYHPDLHPDDKTAKKKFQQVQAAFEVLNDPQKRKMYDQFGPDYEAMAAGRDPRARARSGGQGPQHPEDIDISDIFGGMGGGGTFSDWFGQFRGGQPKGTGRGPKRAARGADLATDLEIPFTTAVAGGPVSVTVSAGGPPKTLDVKILAGAEDGQRMRLRGQGEPGPQGGQPGDLLLTLRVAAHPFFQRQGNDLIAKTPITLSEAALGAKVDIPTPKGVIALKIPAGTSSGSRLRVKGYGVARPDEPVGDLYAEIQIVIPKVIDEKSRELIEQLSAHWSGEPQANPRRDLRW